MFLFSEEGHACVSIVVSNITPNSSRGIHNTTIGDRDFFPKKYDARLDAVSTMEIADVECYSLEIHIGRWVSFIILSALSEENTSRLTVVFI